MKTLRILVLVAAVSACAVAQHAPPHALSFGVRPADFDDAQEPVNRPAKLLEDLDVQYPDSAIRKHLEGVSIVAASIDEHGVVIYGEIRKSSGWPALDSAALRAVAGGNFKPALRKDLPVRSKLTIPVEFRLAAGAVGWETEKSAEELRDDVDALEKHKAVLERERKKNEDELQRLRAIRDGTETKKKGS
ncbi:MAG: energy transducer TonB [Ignavibacteria bacterium]|nr:energy transducer TonB [Ignavibacteria bacterium]